MADPTPGPALPRTWLRRLLYFSPALLIPLGLFLYPTIRYHWTHVVTDDAFVDAPMVGASASIATRVAQVRVSEGDTVHIGQALADLENGLFRAAFHAAQARAEHAESVFQETGLALEIERRKAGPTLEREQADLVAAKARLSSAVLALEDAQRLFGQAEKLAQSDLLSGSELETARIRRDQRQSELDALREEVHKATASRALAHIESIALHQQRVETARAELRRAQAEAEAAELRLSYTKIKSPVRGVIAQTLVQAGERIDEGQTLFLIRDLDAMWITANIEETQIRHIRPGQSARISIDAYPGHSFKGSVVHVGPVTKSQIALIPRQSRPGAFVKVIQRIPVRIAVVDTDSLLRPGMSAVVGIGLNQ